MKCMLKYSIHMKQIAIEYIPLTNLYKECFNASLANPRCEEKMEEILNVDEACKFLKLSKVTLYKHVRSGEIPGVKVGKVWRFHRTKLEDWLIARIDGDSQDRRDRSKK